MSKVKYPRMVINLTKLQHNTELIAKKCHENDIELVCVTKAVCGSIEVAKSMIKGGADKLADSRLENIIKLKKNGVILPCILLRSPMLSEVEDLVKYVDISLVTELETVRVINVEAKRKSKKHKIILMIETGDLREGVMPEDVSNHVQEILRFENIEIIGFGTNLACLSGTIPSKVNMGLLVKIKEEIEREFNIKIRYLSGANSSGIKMLWADKFLPEVNQYRIGEAILLGRETINRDIITGMHQDVFRLEAEIIELKEKPSVPPGETNQNAFGEILKFEDKGKQMRAILALGKQDTYVGGLNPLEREICIISANSDQIVVDLTNNKKHFKIGDVIAFKVDYSALLSAVASTYVNKDYV